MQVVCSHYKFLIIRIYFSNEGFTHVNGSLSLLEDVKGNRMNFNTEICSFIFIQSNKGLAKKYMGTAKKREKILNLAVSVNVCKKFSRKSLGGNILSSTWKSPVLVLLPTAC